LEQENEKEGEVGVQLLIFLKSKRRSKVEVSCYDESLKNEKLMDWISDMESNLSMRKLRP
jgi:hypothetical protein